MEKCQYKIQKLVFKGTVCILNIQYTVHTLKRSSGENRFTAIDHQREYVEPPINKTLINPRPFKYLFTQPIQSSYLQSRRKGGHKTFSYSTIDVLYQNSLFKIDITAKNEGQTRTDEKAANKKKLFVWFLGQLYFVGSPSPVWLDFLGNSLSGVAWFWGTPFPVWIFGGQSFRCGWFWWTPFPLRLDLIYQLPLPGWAKWRENVKQIQAAPIYTPIPFPLSPLPPPPNHPRNFLIICSTEKPS